MFYELYHNEEVRGKVKKVKKRKKILTEKINFFYL